MLRALSALFAVVALGGAGATAVAGERPQPRFKSVQLRSPTWSPDERRIAFAREAWDATGAVVHSALWVVGDNGVRPGV